MMKMLVQSLFEYIIKWLNDMCKSNDESVSPESLRIIYQTYQDRNNQLNALNYAMLGFTIVFLTAMITIFSNVSKDFQQNGLILFYFVLISIFEITLWRVYANYIDKSVINCYQKIIYCEDKLHISKINNLSLRFSIKNKSRFLDRGHTPIDLFFYGIGIALCVLFLAHNITDTRNAVYAFVFALVILITGVWIIVIKIQKGKELDKCEIVS